MQRKLLNFSIFFILLLSILSCKVKNFREEGLSPSDIIYLDKIENQFKHDSLTKEEYFKYPIERRLMLNNIHILEFNKENRIKERDSLIHYMVKLFNDEQYNSRKKMEQNAGIYSNFISDKRIQMIRMLWSYEDISTNNDGSLKEE